MVDTLAAPTSPAPPRARSVRLSGVEGLRAIAATTVLVTHVSFISGANAGNRYGAWFARLDLGVSIFFVISGFLLWRPYSAAALGQRDRPALGAYLVRRVARIYPAYWLALAGALVVDPDPLPSLWELVRYASLTHIYTDATVIGIGPISQAWSLGTEVSFYVFVPAFAWLVARTVRVTGWDPARTQALALVGLGAAGLATRWVVAVLAPGSSGMVFTWLPANLDLFALGMGAALIANRERAAARADAIARRRGLAEASLALALVAFVVVADHAGLPATTIDAYGIGPTMARQALYGLVAIFLLLPAVFAGDGPGPWRAVLRSRWLGWLGLVSYGIYLWQNVAVEAYISRAGIVVFQTSFATMLVVVAVATVMVAAASWYLAERPVLRVARQVSSRAADRHGSRAR